jgi:hypothetical protein
MNRIIRQTGSAAMDYEFDPGCGFQLEEVRLHLDAAGGTASEDFEITLESNASSNDNEYDVVLASQDMETVTDYVYQPDRPHVFAKGDKINFSFANAKTKQWGLEIIFNGISF